MTRRDSRAELQRWFLDVDELLAAQTGHAISPSTVPSARTDPATWTMSLGRTSPRPGAVDRRAR